MKGPTHSLHWQEWLGMSQFELCSQRFYWYFEILKTLTKVSPLVKDWNMKWLMKQWRKWVWNIKSHGCFLCWQPWVFKELHKHTMHFYKVKIITSAYPSRGISWLFRQVSCISCTNTKQKQQQRLHWCDMTWLFTVAFTYRQGQRISSIKRIFWAFVFANPLSVAREFKTASDRQLTGQPYSHRGKLQKQTF